MPRIQGSVAPSGFSYPLLAAGLCSALGKNAAATLAGMQGGLAGFTEHPRVDYHNGDGVVVANALPIGQSFPLQARVQKLALMALDEVLGQLATGAGPTSAYLAVPIMRGLSSQSLSIALAARLEEHGAKLIMVSPAGHAGFAVVLKRALADLTAKRCAVALVGAVHSCLDDENLQRLRDEERIHGPLNSWGMVPGEAAGILALGGSASPRAPASLIAVGLGKEPITIRSRATCQAKGMTEAMGAALAAMPAGLAVTDIWADLEGEPYRSKELGMANMRLAGRMIPDVEVHHPADCWGDVGTASGVLLCAAAADPPERYAEQTCGLVTLGSEDGTRAAILVQVHPLGPGRKALVSAGFEG